MEPEAAVAGDRADRSGEQLVEAAKADVETRLALLRARYASSFGGGDDEVVRRAVEGAVARDARLRRIQLANADEPVGAFVPFRVADGDRTS